MMDGSFIHWCRGHIIIIIIIIIITITIITIIIIIIITIIIIIDLNFWWIFPPLRWRRNRQIRGLEL